MMDMEKDLRQEILSKTRRVVVKVGTAVLSDRAGALDEERISSLAEEVARLRDRGYLVALVTSGAIGAGLKELALKKRPKDLPRLQAAAAVGQSLLMRLYNESFLRHGYHSAQMLLTRDDFDDRRRYLNARNTLHTLLEMSAIPVINENDTVSTEEIKFGDNDMLSALVANLLDAELLIILTDVPGVFRPGESRPLKVVESITEEVRAFATGEISRGGTGGMDSKLDAASIAISAGCAVIIASGKDRRILEGIFSGESVGTLILPRRSRLSSRKRWIGLSTKPRGRLVVDEGARLALVQRGKSLLASGLAAVAGDFEEGDVVSIADRSGTEFARGLSNYSSRDCEKIRGKKSAQIASLLGTKLFDEVVHRDNLVILKTSRE